jgi:hypothetical protein
MSRVSWAGIAIGNLIDIASSFIVGALVSIPIAFYYALNYRQAIDGSAMRDSGMFIAVSGILGSLCSILAGYVSARIAKHDEILNGALSSVLCVGLIAYSIVSEEMKSYYLALNIASLFLSPALSAFGGYLRSLQRN